ncbi:MAG: AraC family transcriptional regulator [Myxococcota bacterium]
MSNSPEGDDACPVRLHVKRERGVVWVEGQVLDNRMHEHHALQISWAAPGTLVSLRTEGGSCRGRVVVVDGGVSHALSMERGLIALVDASSSVGGRLRGRYLDGDSAAAFDELDGWNGSLREARASLRLGRDAPAIRDARVRAVLAWLDEMEEAERWTSVSLEGALAVAHLSRSRFLHLFSTEVGSPWRTYLVWRRALVAMVLANGDGDLTAAAHAAGYADSAHLSRQFSALFGVTPSTFVKNSHFVQS